MKTSSTTSVLLLVTGALASHGVRRPHAGTDQPVLAAFRVRGGAAHGAQPSLSEAELEELFQRATRLRPELSETTGKERVILPTWFGGSMWLWQQWRGTVLEALWQRMVAVMLAGLSIIGYTDS